MSSSCSSSSESEISGERDDCLLFLEFGIELDNLGIVEGLIPLELDN